MNRLQSEKSPYLQQHKENPVDWYPWGEAAFRKAREEDKPILVSIGYSTCHWCHVMERESFEDESVAGLMNELFVNIKVDREELPAVDHYYMEAVQLLTGAGGWPLNCFLTPERKPFLGGTYFPPEDRGRHVSWRKLLLHVAKVFQDQREKVEEQANRLERKIREQEQEWLTPLIQIEKNVDTIELAEVIDATRSNWDTQNGGLKGAPKFPMPHLYLLLTHWAVIHGKQDVMDFSAQTARAFIEGGLFDVVHGGFSRYCVDPQWRVPHFEKMLYDNAGILELLAVLSGFAPRPHWTWATKKTIQFLKDEMTDSDHLFYSAIDADSEGEEGKFYTWTFSELEAELSEEDFQSICTYFDISRAGNWEESNILYSSRANAQAYLSHQSLTDLDPALSNLHTIRQKRVKPEKDKKKLVEWNAMMIHALFQVDRYTPLSQAGSMASENLTSLLESVVSSRGQLLHRVKMEDQWYGEPTLDDYAYLIRACLSAYSYDFNTGFLSTGHQLASRALEIFSRDNRALLSLMPTQSELVQGDQFTYFDTPYPSGNAIMCKNLHILGTYYDNLDWVQRAQNMRAQIMSKMKSYPSTLGAWVDAELHSQDQKQEIAIIGKDAMSWAQQIRSSTLPDTMIMAAEERDEKFPLLDRKVPSGKTQIFLCENYTCQQPLDDLESFRKKYSASQLN
jgi:uncharacterized protein YyaL (SSP411 family)